MKKIIIRFLFTAINATKKININSFNEIETNLKDLTKKDNNNTIILIDGQLIFKYNKNNKSIPNKNHKKKHRGILTLRKPEIKEIIENLLKNHNNLYILKKGFKENITIINNSNEIFYLPIQQRLEERNPIIIGKIIFDGFIKLEIIIYLINLYKKISLKKIIYITSNKYINFEFPNKEELIIIYLPKL